ncbi:MAG TPA: hypothetical protein VH331_09220 [Allosphingosinicella sp.]|jgi:hypothetical protein|nr:hypothetical protein [Allosphingosinicella sp.]
MTRSPPEISDHLPIALRAYAAPRFLDPPEPKVSPPKRKRSKMASYWTLVFDTETRTDAGQALRFGTYQVRKAEELVGSGIFYDPATVTAEELDTLRAYAGSAGLALLTRDEFADRIFYRFGYSYRATIVGINLPFDISRIAIGHSTSHAKDMRGGFSFQISESPWVPRVLVKHVSSSLSFMRFALLGQPDGRSHRRKGTKKPHLGGPFVDIGTLAKSLFARSFSLAGLSEHLKVPNPKLAFDEFDGPVTEAMVCYAVRDVQTTWECYSELVQRYAALEIASTPIHKVFSEASIGKGHLLDMGIVPWRKMQPDFPHEILGNIMSTYFGGRSEVRIRRELRQVILCDFLSMYPTVCTLMGLWRFVIAEGVTWEDSTAETRELLASINVADLQEKAFWRRLPVLVRVRSLTDIFPVRARFEDEAQPTIGLNFLTSEQPLWFTLADCIAAKLLTGKAPHVVEAVTFTPGPVQPGLRPINISGKAEYAVEPTANDLYRRLIELRQSVKTRRDKAQPSEKEALDIEQNAIKIAANSTSYGVFAEINLAERAKPTGLMVHSGTDAPFSFDADRVEEPGKFFHPLLASLIAGAARLMLAITETLVAGSELEWSFCDTDSMAIAKPDVMGEPEFRKRVQRIVDWFDPLNPYSFGGPILKIEDVNSRIGGGEFTPLYCWAISAKRYCLFNLDQGGQPVIRKASAHGLGHLRAPYGKDDPARDIPAPQVDLGPMKLELWQHDLWWVIVKAALDGHPDRISLNYHPALAAPAISRYGATTPDLLRWFKTYNVGKHYSEQVKPFGFLLALTANPVLPVEVIGKRRGRKPALRLPKPIATFDRDPRNAAAAAFDRDTGAPIAPSALKSFRQALAQYHLRSESKFLNGDYADRGITRRRHVFATGTEHIGKEANRWEEQFFLGANTEASPHYGMSTRCPAKLAADAREAVAVVRIGTAAQIMGMSRLKLRKALTGDKAALSQLLKSPMLPSLYHEAKLRRAAVAVRIANLHAAVQRFGLREAARLLRMDASNLRREMLRAQRYGGR